MDVLDYADVEIESYMNYAIKSASKPLAKELYPNGECHNCHETVGPNKLFCDNNCATSYERLKSRRP